MNCFDFTSNLKIRGQLAFFIAFPTLIAVMFAGMNIYEKMRQREAVKNSYDFVILSLELTRMVEQLQKERGLSLGYGASQGKRFGKELLAQRGRTNEAISAFARGKEKYISSHENKDLIAHFEKLEKELERIERERRLIDTFNRSSLFPHFSSINEIALNLVQVLKVVTQDSGFSHKADSFSTLLWVQEFAGRERDVLTDVFSSKTLPTENMLKFIFAKTSQDDLIQNYLSVSDNEKKARFIKVLKKDKDFQEVEKIRNTLLTKIKKTELFGQLQLFIGYGGLIHNFKNYLLRGDKKYLDSFERNYLQAEKTLSAYRGLKGVTAGEESFLDLIDNSIRKYRSHLAKAVEMKSRGIPVERVDKALAIDDSPALNAISSLRVADIDTDPMLWWNLSTRRIGKIESERQSIGLELEKMSREALDSNSLALSYYFLGILIAIAITVALGIFIQRRLSSRIVDVSTSMKEMQRTGEFNRGLQIEGQDEIAEMAQTFNDLFSKNKAMEMEKTWISEELESREMDFQDLDKKFRTILDAAGTGIFGLDTECQTTFMNKAGLKILGFSIDEALGKNLHSLIHHTHKDGSPFPIEESPIYGALSKGETHHGIESYFWRKDGTCIPVQYTSTPVWKDGEVVGAVVVYDDLSELERARSLLSEQKRWSDSLIINSIDCMVSIDEGGEIIFFNPASEKLFGYKAEEVIGKNVNILLPEPERSFHDGYLRNYLETGVAKIIGIGREVTGLSKDGKEFPLYLRISEFEHGGKRNFLGTLEDISLNKEHEKMMERHALDLEIINSRLKEENIKRANAEAKLKIVIENLNRKIEDLDRFAYITSHDLKAPLRGISSLAEWIEQDLEGPIPEQVRSHLEKMKGRVHRLEGLINGILDYSRASQAKLPEEDVDMNALLNDIVDMLPRPEGFAIEVQKNLPMIHGERIKIQQVFINLIQNAIKHHDQESGKIRISAFEKQGEIQFRIEDDGPGIAPEFRGKIFEIFQTLHARDKKEATGIGLALVKRIIEDRGGSIVVESVEPHGAAFCFTWPLKVPDFQYSS